MNHQLTRALLLITSKFKHSNEAKKSQFPSCQFLSFSKVYLQALILSGVLGFFWNIAEQNVPSKMSQAKFPVSYQSKSLQKILGHQKKSSESKLSKTFNDETRMLKLFWICLEISHVARVSAYLRGVFRTLSSILDGVFLGK